MHAGFVRRMGFAAVTLALLMTGCAHTANAPGMAGIAGGAPAAVAPLEPMTPDQKRRWRAAELRRELRRELNARFAEARQVGDS